MAASESLERVWVDQEDLRALSRIAMADVEPIIRGAMDVNIGKNTGIVAKDAMFQEMPKYLKLVGELSKRSYLQQREVIFPDGRIDLRVQSISAADFKRVQGQLPVEDYYNNARKTLSIGMDEVANVYDQTKSIRKFMTASRRATQGFIYDGFFEQMHHLSKQDNEASHVITVNNRGACAFCLHMTSLMLSYNDASLKLTGWHKSCSCTAAIIFTGQSKSDFESDENRKFSDDWDSALEDLYDLRDNPSKARKYLLTRGRGLDIWSDLGLDRRKALTYDQETSGVISILRAKYGYH